MAHNISGSDAIKLDELTEDTFKKMVLALPDKFFEGWQYSIGDKIIINTDDIHIIYASTPYKTYAVRADSENSAIAHVSKCFDKDSNIRPLPNQKQLQSMIGLSPIEFIEDFYAFSQEPLLPTMDNEQFRAEVECFTLAYVQDRKYKMCWDGEKWVGVK